MIEYRPMDACTRPARPWERWEWQFQGVMATPAYRRALLSVLMAWAVHDRA